jgi:hypothetical protein
MVVASHAPPESPGLGLGVWVALLGFLATSAALLLLVVVIAVAVVAGGSWQQPAGPGPVTVAPPPPPDEWEEEDLGPLQIRDRRVRRQPRGGGEPAPTPAAPEPEAPPAPTGPPPDSVVLTLPPGVRVTQVEMSCPSGKRVRQTPVAGKVVFEGVSNESCRVSFKGGTITTAVQVDPGTSLSCQPMGSSALACR